MGVHVGYTTDEWLGSLSLDDVTEMNEWVWKNNKEMI
jgi:hypothetical protein